MWTFKATTSYVYINIILPPTPRSAKKSQTFRFFSQNINYFLLLHEYYQHPPPNNYLFHHHKRCNISLKQRAYITTIFTEELSPFFSYLDTVAKPTHVHKCMQVYDTHPIPPTCCGYSCGHPREEAYTIPCAAPSWLRPHKWPKYVGGVLCV